MQRPSPLLARVGVSPIALAALLAALSCGKQQAADPPPATAPVVAASPAAPATAPAVTPPAPSVPDAASAEPADAPTAPAAIPPNVALLVTKAGLVGVDLADGSVKTLAPGAVATTCLVDPRARVVWLATGPSERDKQDGRLLAFDLEGSGPPVLVAAQLAEFDTLAVDYGPEQLGGTDKVAFEVGLQVVMGPAPRIAALVGCDGDREHYCYEDGEEGAPRALNADLKARQTALDALQPADAAALVAWFERGAGRPLGSPRTPADAQPRERVASVPVDGCRELPEDCGTARVVDGTPFWRVVTANDRGDFFYQQEQLYDPRDKTFFDLAKPTQRSAKPLIEATSLEGVLVAPSGDGFLATLPVADELASVVGTFDGRVIFSDAEATVCGWAGGGWRVPGPRDE